MRTFAAVLCPGCENYCSDLYYFGISSLYPNNDFICAKCCEDVIMDYQYRKGCPKCRSDLVVPKSHLVKSKKEGWTYIKEYSTCHTCNTDYFAPYQDVMDEYHRKLVKKTQNKSASY